MASRSYRWVALVVLLAGTAAAQTTTATLQGLVRDTSGAVLPGVTVTVRSPETGFTRTVTTDGKGEYYVTFIPVGRYDVSVDLAGFQTQVREGLRFELGQEATLDFAMPVAAVAEAVTVTGETGLVATTKSTVDNVIKRDQLDLLPVAGRNAANLAMLAPGVVPRGSTEEPVTSEGQPRGSTEALLDGVSNKLVLINSIRSKSTTRRPITPTSAP